VGLHQIEQVVRQHKVLNYSSLDPDLQRGCLWSRGQRGGGVEQALRALGGDATIAVIPEGPYVFALPGGEYVAEHSVEEMMAE